jgi:centromere protein C
MIPPALPVENPEEGWDDGTKPQCVVLQYKTLQEVERRKFAYGLELGLSK